MAAFIAAIDAGAGIECDVRLAADGQVVVFHDHDLRRLCASALAVEATRSEILARQKLFDSDQSIPLLRDLLDLVGGKSPLLIEVKCRGGNAARIAAAVAHLLDHYRGPVGVMSFEPGVGRWFARHAPQCRRGLVISAKANGYDRWRGLRLAAPHFVAVDRAALGKAWSAKARELRWLYAWTIRTPEQRSTAQVHADALIWEADGRP